MGREGVKGYFLAKKDELAIILADKNQNLRRLEAQRNELNAKGTHTSWTTRRCTQIAARSRGTLGGGGASPCVQSLIRAPSLSLLQCAC
jgi:hypothetical protein